MPTYTIDYGNAPDGWANAANSLANAFATDYEAEANARLRGAQATNSYAGAYANEQLGRQRGAAAALDERVLNIWQEADAKLAEAGITDPQERMLIIGETLGRTGGVDGGNFGDWALGMGGLQGLPEAQMQNLQLGSGMDMANTIEGFDQDQPRQSSEFIMGEAGETARNRMDNEGEMERLRFETFQSPVGISENETMIFGTEDPRAVSGGVQGQRSVAVNEAIIPPGGTEADMIAGPQFAAKAPDAPTSRTITDGLETVTQEWTEDGWVEVARGPRTGSATGEVSLSPTQQVFVDDAVATLNSALAAGRDADQKIAEIDNLTNYLTSGVPTGFWTDKTMPIRQALTSFGIADQETTGQIEALTSGLGNRVMARIQETKGAVSNAEMDYFRRISASIGNTPYGNMLLLQKERAVQERARRMRNFALSLQEQDLSEREITEALEQFKNDNPVFDPQEILEIEALGGNPDLGAPPAVPGTGNPAFDDLDIDRYLD